MLDRAGMKHKYADHIEHGKPVWSRFHVTDVARGYSMLMR
jgi:hypothetical protein